MSISSLSAIEENNTSLNVPVMTGDSLVHLSEDSDDDNDLSLDTDITSSFENYFNAVETAKTIASILSSTKTSILLDVAWTTGNSIRIKYTNKAMYTLVIVMMKYL